VDGSAELPLLVAAGPTGRTATAARVLFFLRLGLLALLALSLAVPFIVVAVIPKGPPGKPPAANPAFLVPMIVASSSLLALALVLLLVNHLLQNYVLRRAGRVDVFLDRIVLYKKDRTIEVPWKKVKRLVVRSPDYVQIVRKLELRGSPLRAIPTPSQAAQWQLFELWAKQKDGTLAPGTAASPELLGRGSMGKLLLVAAGSARWKLAKFWLEFVAAGLYAGGMLYAALIREGRITSPWIDLVKSWLWGWQVAILVTIGPIVAYFFARRWLRDFATKRVGRAEVFEAGVVFYRADQMTPVPWSMLGGFDDSSADVIELQLKGSRVRFTIPTPQEDLRVRVLALLEERGIPRLDV